MKTHKAAVVTSVAISPKLMAGTLKTKAETSSSGVEQIWNGRTWLHHALLSVIFQEKHSKTGRKYKAGTRVLGLLICPKIAEAKIMIKRSAFLYTP